MKSCWPCDLASAYIAWEADARAGPNFQVFLAIASVFRTSGAGNMAFMLVMVSGVSMASLLEHLPFVCACCQSP